MECNSLQRSESRQTLAYLIAAEDDSPAASGLTCAEQSCAWMTRICLFLRCSLALP